MTASDDSPVLRDNAKTEADPVRIRENCEPRRNEAGAPFANSALSHTARAFPTQRSPFAPLAFHAMAMVHERRYRQRVASPSFPLSPYLHRNNRINVFSRQRRYLATFVMQLTNRDKSYAGHHLW